MAIEESETPPKPPFHAVIFVSQRTPGDQGYGAAAQRMDELARQQPGFLGVESARGPDGKGITVVFYDSEDAIRGWGRNAEHREVQSDGRRQWYDEYQIYYAHVEKARSWRRPDPVV